MGRERARARRIVPVAGGALGVLSLTACAFLLGGCSSQGRRLDLAGPPPLTLQQDRVADVQVVRRGTRLEMTNATARTLPAGRLWVNRRFSRAVDAFGPGESLRLELTGFRDRDGRPFRAGGFFAIRDPVPVVLVQLEVADEAGVHAGELIGFVVVENDLN